jgi:AAA15 family ATPase/GTPase
VLLRIRFSNFRSFRTEQELSLVAGPFSDLPDAVRHSAGIRDGILSGAAIYGANASGKTNVIKAVQFISSAVTFSHRSWSPDGPIPLDPFIANKESRREPSDFEVDFLLGGVRYRYGFTIDSEAVLEEWLYAYPAGKKQTWFHRKRGIPITFSKKMPGENRTIENLTRKNSLFLSAAAQNNHEALQPIYGWLSGILFVEGDRRPYLIHTAELSAQSDYKTEIAKLVAAADLGIADIAVEQAKLLDETKALVEAIKTIYKIPPEKYSVLPEERTELRLLHRFNERTVRFDNGQESAGTIAYLSLLGPVVYALKKGKPLLVDELDASLHPLLGIVIIRLFNSAASNPNGAQLIFNTHDTNVLSSGILRRDQIWFTEKRSDGSSHLFALSDFKPRLHENLHNGYLQGRYGAIPFINSDAFLSHLEAGNGKTG